MKIVLSVADKEKAKGVNSLYLRALVAAGAGEDEVELVSTADGDRLRRADFDGVLFAGGEDVDPALYEQEKKFENVKVNRARDEFEVSLLHRGLDRRLPILGICRGVQMINVGFGGTLYQDLAQEAPTELQHQQADAGLARSDLSHTVTVTEPDSLLHQAVQGSCRVNSLHHQAIKLLGRGLRATAHSEDGLVEAVEAAEDYPFLLAVQWHPEEIVDHAEQRRIFEEFVAQCREAAAQKVESRG